MSGGRVLSSEGLSRQAPRGKTAAMSESAKPTREERLAAKLRENLHRRKAQARALAEPAAPLPNPDDGG